MPCVWLGPSQPSLHAVWPLLNSNLPRGLNVWVCSRSLRSRRTSKPNRMTWLPCVFVKLLTIPKNVTERAQGSAGEKPTSGRSSPLTRTSVRPLVHSFTFTPGMPISSAVRRPLSALIASLRFRTIPNRPSHTNAGEKICEYEIIGLCVRAGPLPENPLFLGPP